MLDRIVAALRARRGVCMLTGEPGTGKTTALRRALDELATSSPLVPICGNAPLDLEDLIALLGAIPSTSSGSREEQLEEVQKRLRELAEGGRPVVLAIDEAQALEEEMLEDVISLLGRASAPDALASLLLVGQPALASRLEARGSRSPSVARSSHCASRRSGPTSPIGRARPAVRQRSCSHPGRSSESRDCPVAFLDSSTSSVVRRWPPRNARGPNA